MMMAFQTEVLIGLRVLQIPPNQSDFYIDSSRQRCLLNDVYGVLIQSHKKRFNAISTRENVSLVIFNVTVADDKANGEFTCELIDSNPDTWKRAIQVQVIGKLEGVSDGKKEAQKLEYIVIQFIPLGLF